MVKVVGALVTVYAAVAVFTYGWSFVGLERSNTPTGLAALSATFAAAGWPFYWSIQVAREVRK